MKRIAILTALMLVAAKPAGRWHDRENHYVGWTRADGPTEAIDVSLEVALPVDRVRALLGAQPAPVPPTGFELVARGGPLKVVVSAEGWSLGHDADAFVVDKEGDEQLSRLWRVSDHVGAGLDGTKLVVWRAFLEADEAPDWAIHGTFQRIDVAPLLERPIESYRVVASPESLSQDGGVDMSKLLFLPTVDGELAVDEVGLAIGVSLDERAMPTLRIARILFRDRGAPWPAKRDAELDAITAGDGVFMSVPPVALPRRK